MADITIAHTRADGTLVKGSVKGDGVWEILKAQPYSWKSSRNIGLYLQQSRDKAAKTWIINAAADALRAARHTVTVTIDDTAPGRTTAEIEEDRADRADARAGRYAGRSQRRGEQAAADYARARQMAAAIPFGQPSMPDHHSYRRDMNYRARMGRTYDRAFEGMDQAGQLAVRAEAAAANQSHHESIPATLRRIETLEARERSLQRDIAGHPDWVGNGQGGHKLTLVKPQGEYLARLEADLEQVRADLDYWREYVAGSGEKVWGPGDFAKGDFVTAGGGTWYQVERVNPKSLSVPHGTDDHQLGGVVTRDRVRHAMGPSQWTRKITYDEVRGRRPAADMGEALLAARLTEYLAAKRRHEDLVAEHARSGWTPGDPWPEHVKRAEARVNELKAAGGYGGPDDAACCRKYGFLHEPSYSRAGCRWLPVPGAAADDVPAQEG